MSQDIADMPGIDAAMERFNAMVPAAPAKTETASGSATGNQSSDTRAPRVGVSDSKADAQPAADASKAQNSDSNPISGFAKATPDGARAAAGGSATGSEAASVNGHQRRDDKGRFVAPETRGGTPPQPGGSTTGQGETPALHNGGTGERRLGTRGETPLEPGGSTTGQSETPALQDKSRYAKAQERLDKTWEAVNRRKGDLDAQASALEQQRLTLERDKAQFEAIRRQAEQPQATPEQALQAAGLRRRDADALRMQAKRAEESGRLDEVQRLNKQADKAESLADELGAYAEELRKNPPVSMQQRQQQFEQARKQWTLEACNAFPELGANGSRLQQVVAQHLNALAKQDPQLLAHPSLIYHVARLADSQIRVSDLEAAAARVPLLEKEAESLRARIKDLEAATTPAGEGGVARLGNESTDDYASLRQSAVELGHGRW